MTSIQFRRHELRFLPDRSRVFIRPFIPADRSRLTQIIGRVLALSEEETERELEIVRRAFTARHRDLDSSLLAIYRRTSGPPQSPSSPPTHSPRRSSARCPARFHRATLSHAI